MLCIGYGRFIPTLLSEATITIFSMVTGATFYALFIAHSMAYIQQRDSARRLYQEKVCIFMSFIIMILESSTIFPQVVPIPQDGLGYWTSH